ncbi:hypothetical protein, conserved [Eimeria tenella]|uniref:RRM domain-containing protein n=1 Tax=Eimeria tenella TaxID=5802 RepID=U6KWK9_EIMTE|nr:hypothetical protein, conserved [Eimeria tenella]CDJ41313.1 hypothetical protein, conserved [Eimeria tenella]|eukprot:XP_013232063.1 hypothetical protein, conserved [Eimeria tenella]
MGNFVTLRLHSAALKTINLKLKKVWKSSKSLHAPREKNERGQVVESAASSLSYSIQIERKEASVVFLVNVDLGVSEEEVRKCLSALLPVVSVRVPRSSAAAVAGSDTLLLHNLPLAATEAALYRMASGVAAVKKTRMARDSSSGKPLGYGYVQLQSAAAAAAALVALQQQQREEQLSGGGPSWRVCSCLPPLKLNLNSA